MTTRLNSDNSVHIVLHPSLWINKKGEDDAIGKKMAQHLSATFPVSDISFISEELFILQEIDYRKPDRISQNKWYFGHREGNYEQWTHQFDDKKKVILVWGSGEHHQVSSHISLRQTEYTRIVWDRHEDNQRLDELHILRYTVPSREGCFLDCERVYKNGRLRKTIFAHENRDINILLSSLERDTVLHGSVDLDVVEYFPARGDWQFDYEYREVSKDELFSSVSTALNHPNIGEIRRFDVGGLHPLADGDQKYYRLRTIIKPTDPGAFDFAVNCYETLIRMAYERMSR